MKTSKIMQSVSKMGEKYAVKQAGRLLCRTFIYQPKVPTKLLEMKK